MFTREPYFTAVMSLSSTPSIQGTILVSTNRCSSMHRYIGKKIYP